MWIFLEFSILYFLKFDSENEIMIIRGLLDIMLNDKDICNCKFE